MNPLSRYSVFFLALLFSFSVSAQVDLNAGLLGYYPFNGNADDASGNGNHGILQNGVSLTTDRYGNPNSAFYFDGVDDHILVQDNGKLSAPAISISAMVYAERATAQSITGKIQRNTGFHSTYHLGINYDVQSGFFYGVGPEFTPCNQQIPYDPSNPFSTSTWNFSTHEWHCVVGTFQDSVIKIYVDGVLIDSRKYNFKNLDVCTNTDFLIGRWWNGDPVPFQGKIDEVKVYNRALNQEEVHALCSSLDCDQWLGLPAGNAYAIANDVDIAGSQLTVEAKFNRTTAYSGGPEFAGDLVSKHMDPTNTNYLLRPNGAEITTTIGYYKTPDVCEIELHKTYHVAMTYDGATLKFYRNGALLSQIAATGTLIQNNISTRIGYYEAMLHPESLTGYIDEVRIWNTVRSQQDIHNFMNSLIPFPATQAGLVAYYNFDNLINKQGNPAFNLTLSPGATVNQTNPDCEFLPDSCGILVNPNLVIPFFTAPDTVCINTPVTVTNTSTNATSSYWNFCQSDLNQAPEGVNLGNVGGNLAAPVFMDFVFANNNYYGFSINFSQGHLIRHDFGNSLLNTPSTIDLGNFGGVIPPVNSAEGIQVVQNEGNWYAIIVGGYPSGSSPRIVKIDFGTDITNTSPTPTNWGNIGNLNQPIDLHVFKENNRWYGFTVNSEDATITRFDFTSSFNNIPTAVNLGNLGGLSYPTGICAINDNGYWRVFITNAGNNTRLNGPFSLTRLDFGTSLLNNSPAAVNLGSLGNVLQHPRDITILKNCGQIIGYAVNGHMNNRSLVKLDFNNDLTSTPNATSLGNIGNLGFPHSISKLFRVNEDTYAFVTNADNNTITRLRFAGCSNSSIPSFVGSNPPAFTYNKAGIYNINLTVDEGLSTQASFCKQIVVLPNADFSFDQDDCDPLAMQFNVAGNHPTGILWKLGDGNQSGLERLMHVYNNYGNYIVELEYEGACATSKTISVNLINTNILLTQDTLICDGSAKQLRTLPAASFCWYPTTHLDDPLSPNPTSFSPENITYYFTASIKGANLLTNGNFSAGNTGFSSSYIYASSNSQPGEYVVTAAPSSWNPAVTACNDHSGSGGNMLLVQGTHPVETTVWEETIAVTPNTNYNFSGWIQSMSATSNVSMQLSINGNPIGDSVFASAANCTWAEFGSNWNSGNTTIAVLSLIDRNSTNPASFYALDDISFSTITMEQDSVVILVEVADVQTNSDTSICNTSIVSLVATGAATYQWTPAIGLSDPMIANPVATPETTTEYIVTGTTTNGCIAKDTVNIIVHPLPQINITPDTMVCINSPTLITASGGVSYSWSPTTGLDYSNLADPIATIDTTRRYKVLVTNLYNCSAEDSVLVSVRPYPVFTASSNQIICDGSIVRLNASGGDNYQWSPAALVDNPTSGAPTTAPNTSTTYSVYISENVCGFDTTIKTHVHVNPVPVMTVNKSNDVNCNTPTAELKATGAVNYLWTPAQWLDKANSSTTVAAIDTTTLFTVTGSNQFGCKSTEEIMVRAEKTGVPRFVVPNAFTPNNDGKNDCFGIKRWGNASINMFSIYNRWGQLIFQTKDPSKCWDGTFNGKPQDAGGYVYVIQANTLCGFVNTRGIVTLVR